MKRQLQRPPASARKLAVVRAAAEALEARTLLAVTPAGAEFRVNLTTANDQALAAVAADASGDFVVVFHTDEGGANQTDVHARRYSLGGTALGDEFRVNTFTTGIQRDAAVAMDADGDFVVVWHSNLQDGDGYGVYAQRYTAAGVAEGGEFLVNTTTAQRQLRPAVAMDADGDFVVAWVQAASGFSGEIFARRFTATGVPAGPEFKVGAETSGQRAPAVAMNAVGAFAVAWDTANADPSLSHVFAQRYSASGGAAGNVLQVSTAGVNNASAAVAMDVGGELIVAYQSEGRDGSGSGVYARRYSPAGSPLGGDDRVNTTTTGFQGLPAVAADADGDFAVLWAGNGPGDDSGVFGQRFSTAGVAAGAEFRVNTTTPGLQSAPSAAMGGEGDFLVAWHSNGQDGSGFGVYAQRYDESENSAAPVVGGVVVDGNTVFPGERLVRNVPQAVVNFSKPLTTLGGAAGANSATNPANYRLTRNGADASSRIASVSFAFRDATRKHEAVLTFDAPLPDGDYVLRALQSIRDTGGIALDGNFDGAPLGDYTLAFSVRQPVNVGPEFRVNTTTAGDQRSAAVAASDDQFVVAWTGGNATVDRDVFARRYSPGGAPLGDEFRVNTTTADEQSAVAVASQPDGGFIVAWTSVGQDGDAEGVYAQRFDGAGARVGGEFLVNTTTAGNQSAPAVSVDGDGDFVVAWRSAAPGDLNYDIYARRYASAGTPRGGEFLVNTTTDGRQNTPDVAVAGNGNFVVTWFGPDGSGQGVFARRYTADGFALGDEFPVNTTTAGSQAAASVAADAAGNFVVAWQGVEQGAQNVFAQRYDAAGVRRGGEFRVNTFTAGDQQAVNVAMDRDGDFVIAWEDNTPGGNGQDGSSFGVYAQRYAASGAALGGEFRVNSTTASHQRTPRLASDADGDFVVAWQSNAQDGDGYGVYAQRYAANEAPVSRGIPNVSVQRDAPNTAIDLFAAFDDSTDPDPALIYVVIGNTNPALFASTPISVTPAAGTLTLAYSFGRTGVATLVVRALDRNGGFADAVFTVTVTVTGPPLVTSSEFVFASGPQQVRFTFSQNVSATFSSADLSVVSLDPGGGPVALSGSIYVAQTNTGSIGIAGGRLPNGNYRATLHGAGIQNAAGVVMPADHVFDFFVLAGDVNRDRSVNGTDFAILAANFGKTGMTFAQGDVNGDGAVNGTDFAILAGNFGRTVPPPAAVAAAAPAAADAAPAARVASLRRVIPKSPPPRRRAGDSQPEPRSAGAANP